MSGEELSRAELRASHEDRDLVVDQLRVAAGDGRIDGDELDQRIEAAMSARTFGELDVLIKDLPASSQQAHPARRTEAEASQNIDISHGNTHKRGAWLVPRRLNIAVRHGNVLLDFTEAVFSGVREVEVVLDVRHGNLRFVVPSGTTLDTSGLTTRHANLGQPDLGPATPDAIRLVLSGRAEHANVRVRRLPRFMQRRRQRRALPRG
ncbi:DUF1707 domain-containing protein [Catenulispora sp. NF23]|uniref:DUF1707 domain-containing protein n=1 Tax=Catenulispora pinistramenti TaxID=2705254 RepID=A0ABS5L2V0_9ACTN|nr:DUF1707 domain-containing protein [Catenulispora pinistramenti]MBS2536106.1 DUF1707 domain-containing protein [Catenulispora pinistramenti]MBS2552616.1 DUF1707 domain-containing protein [Catenulispora pinistramenti]